VIDAHVSSSRCRSLWLCSWTIFPFYTSSTLNLLNGFYSHWSHFMVWLNLYGREPISFVLHLLNALYSRTN
jgi:hypothetical protein